MKNRLTAGLATLILVALAISQLTGCKKPDAPPLKIALTAWVGWAPLYLAQEKGLFARHGLKNVELVTIDDTAARKAAMLSNRVDAYASSVDNWALDSAHGLSGKILFAFDESAGGDGIIAKKSIGSLAGLKGKTVATQPGMPGQFLLLHLAKKNGLNVKDINVVDMDADKAGAAFVAGTVDAAVTWEPWLSKAAASGGHILASTRDNRGLIVDVLVSTDKSLASRKADHVALAAAWFDALKYWKENKDEAEAIMAKALNLKVDEFRGMTTGVEYFDLAKNRTFFGGNGFRDTFSSAAAIWRENGLTTRDTEPAAAYDPAILDGVKQQ